MNRNMNILVALVVVWIGGGLLGRAEADKKKAEPKRAAPAKTVAKPAAPAKTVVRPAAATVAFAAALARAFHWRSFRDTLGKATLVEVRRAIALPQDKIDAASTFDLAVALYVLNQEGEAHSAGAKSFQNHLDKRSVKRDLNKGGKRTRTGAEVRRYAAFIGARYAIPCEGKKVRYSHAGMPPHYKCEGAPKDVPLSRAPEQVVPVSSVAVLAVPPDEIEDREGASGSDEKLKRERLEWLRTTAERLLPAEKKGVGTPTKFCVGTYCAASYKDVARKIYGARHVSDRNDDAPPVFCAPKREGASGWSTTMVDCSSDWRTTVGKELDDSPKWACIGSNEFLSQFILPGHGSAGSDGGFRCRARVFHIIQPINQLSAAAEDEAIDRMCTLMRRQTWGDDIAQRVADKEAKEAGKKPAPLTDPPRWALTREEFLYFYGHTNKYCRANRKLTHRIDNGEVRDETNWAETFTCGVPRGILESGPFEEGVQVCATTPYLDRSFKEVRSVLKDPAKGRLHCWKFNRPMCKEIAKGETKKRMWISDVFDHYDILGELRRTRDPDVLGMKDMKKITERPTFEMKQELVYQDSAKEIGVGSIKEFCRFHGNRGKVVCGYDQKSMAQYYEMRAHEAPEGCHDGVCQRGHYDRGYACAVHTSPDIFGGKKKVWICGYDRGPRGRELLKPAHWICTGGRWLKEYVDPEGNRGTLRCGKRAFHWGEDLATTKKIHELDPLDFVKKWVVDHKLTRRKIEVSRRWKDEHAAEYAKWNKFKSAGGLLKELAGTVTKAMDNHVVEVKDEKIFYGVPWKNSHDENKMRLLLDSTDGKHDKLLDKQMKSLFDALDDIVTDRAGFLGHRLTIRNYYLADPDGNFKNLHSLKRDYPRLTGLLEDGFSKLVRNKKTEALYGLIDAVKKNTRAPDGQWFQEVRNELVDEKHALTIMKGEIVGGREVLISAFLHFAMFDMLDKTRRMLLKEAREYFRDVAGNAGKSAPLTRYELMEEARIAPVAPQEHGSVFCVERLSTKPPKRLPRGQKSEPFYPQGEFICGSSPLLLPGAVEVYADKRAKDFEGRYAKAARNKEHRVEANEREQIRLEAKNSVGSSWCYGATPGELPKLDDNSRALEKGAGSPWEVSIPKREKEDLRDGFLRCEKFQFTDEVWLMAILKDEKQGEDEDAGGGAAGDAGGAMALVGDGMESVMGKLGDIAKIIKDLGGPDLTMIKKYVDQAMALVKVVAEAAKGEMSAVQDLAGKAADKVKDLLSDETKALVAAAATPGDATSKAVTAVKEKLADAKAKVKETVGKVEGKFKELQKKAKELKGSGGIVAALANELIGFLSGKIIGFVEPFARKLINLLMNLLQPLVTALKTGIAGAVAGIPFGGGALVMAVNAAFDFVWKAIVDLITNKLMGVVERLLTMGLRAAFGPVVKAVRGMVMEGIQSLCVGLGISDFCPDKFAALPAGDAWLNGALACGEAEPSQKELREIAAAAQVRLTRRSERLVAAAHGIGRRFADRYLARYGYTVDTWTALNGPRATAEERALAARLGPVIDRDIRMQVAMKRR